MSKLLINEPPLQVLPTLAKVIGLNEAIILQQIHFLAPNGKKADGYEWVVKTANEWSNIFPFWSQQTIRRAMGNLRITGFVVTANYNKANYDKTLWWRVNYAALSQLETKPYDQNDHRPYDQIDNSPRDGQIDNTNTLKKDKKGEEEKIIPENGVFGVPKGLADKSKKYAALTSEPTLRDRAIVACQGLGITHFSGIFKKRQDALGRTLQDVDWQEILDWCAHYEQEVAAGKIYQAGVAPLLVAAIRDGEPVPLKPKAWQTTEEDEPQAEEAPRSVQAVLAEIAAQSPDSEEGIIWGQALSELALQMTSATYDTWVRDTQLVRLTDDGIATIQVPNKYAQAWLDERLRAMIKRTLGGMLKRSVTVEFKLVNA